MKKYFRFEDIVSVNFQCFSPRKCSYVEGFIFSGFHVSFWGEISFYRVGFFSCGLKTKVAWQQQHGRTICGPWRPGILVLIFITCKHRYDLILKSIHIHVYNVTVHICCMLIEMWNLVALLKVTHRSIPLQNFRFFGIKVCIHDNNSGFKESKLLQRTVPGA